MRRASPGRIPPRALERAVPWLVAAACLLLPAAAHAHPWMVRRQYTNCTPCHVDPSGGGAITRYGRMLADIEMRSGRSPEDEAGKSAELLFGAVETPEWLDLGGDLRGLFLETKTPGSRLRHRYILMQADLEATIQSGRFVASGSLGFAHEGALGAALTRGEDNNLISRQHWAGYYLNADSSALLRAGRMNLPFGLRVIEHTLWTRALTRTDINDDQQLGAALSYVAPSWRGELMGILGNFQLRPDAFRERGYSAYAEYAPTTRLAFGVSSLVTHRDLDDKLLREAWRQSHGVFAKWATGWTPLVLMTEWSYTLLSPRDDYWRAGAVGHLQADLELVQGSHFIGTLEAHNVGIQGPPLSTGGWLSYMWFLAPHTDVRLDGIYRSLQSDFGGSSEYTLLLQAHLYL